MGEGGDQPPHRHSTRALKRARREKRRCCSFFPHSRPPGLYPWLREDISRATSRPRSQQPGATLSPVLQRRGANPRVCVHSITCPLLARRNADCGSCDAGWRLRLERQDTCPRSHCISGQLLGQMAMSASIDTSHVSVSLAV